MKRMVVVFLDDVRKGSCTVSCDGVTPSKGQFQDEARRVMVADGSLSIADAARAQFIVQD